MSQSRIDNFKVNAPKHIDYWRYKPDGSAYISVAEAHELILYKFRGRECVIAINDVETEYWYVGGIELNNLVKKYTASTSFEEDEFHRTVPDTKIAFWDAKQPAGDYATNSDLASGLGSKQPSGDYATNASLNSGLNSKQDTLVSGVNIRTFNGQSILGVGDMAGGHADFKDVAYSASLNIVYDSVWPNINITSVSGNLSLSITGTTEGASGIVTIPLTSGSESITLNGATELSNFPSGAGKVVSLSYIHQPEGLKWYCNNPNLNKTASDFEITDYTKGYIGRTSSGRRVRITFADKGASEATITLTVI